MNNLPKETEGIDATFIPQPGGMTDIRYLYLNVRMDDNNMRGPSMQEDWVVHEVRVRKTYSYVPDMVEEILCRRLNDSKPLFRPAELLPTDPRRIRPRLAPVPLPAKEELVRSRKSRFCKFAARKPV